MVGGLYVRIVIMQIAIIAGAIFAKTYGSIAPLLIVIGFKTLADMAASISGSSAALKGADMVFGQYVGDELTENPPRCSHVSVLMGLIGNLIPLYGVLYWQWDAFQLLMLYWTETVIIAFWTILGITRLPADRLGTITVGGRAKPATHKLLCGYFTLVAGMFILGHLAFLWMHVLRRMAQEGVRLFRASCTRCTSPTGFGWR